jgi:hypothetical protein
MSKRSHYKQGKMYKIETDNSRYYKGFVVNPGCLLLRATWNWNGVNDKIDKVNDVPAPPLSKETIQEIEKGTGKGGDNPKWENKIEKKLKEGIGTIQRSKVEGERESWLWHLDMVRIIGVIRSKTFYK